MNVNWTSAAWNDYLYWQTTDKNKLKRINLLIRDTLRNPFEGVGKPEPLKHDLKGFWSRRIDREHRLIYSHEDQQLHIISCRFHY
ncbi:MAG: toxin YoeB [Bacteroidia bacterium]|jgi:toxin YoeB